MWCQLSRAESCCAAIATLLLVSVSCGYCNHHGQVSRWPLCCTAAWQLLHSAHADSISFYGVLLYGKKLHSLQSTPFPFTISALVWLGLAQHEPDCTYIFRCAATKCVSVKLTWPVLCVQLELGSKLLDTIKKIITTTNPKIKEVELKNDAFLYFYILAKWFFYSVLSHCVSIHTLTFQCQ